MEYLIVLIAGVAGYAFGAVWYGTLGALWREDVGLSVDDVKPANNVAAYILALVGNVLVAGMARHIFASSGLDGVVAGAVSGLGLGLFVAGSYLAINYGFAKRSRRLAVIDIGHAAGSAAVIGAVLGGLS